MEPATKLHLPPECEHQGRSSNLARALNLDSPEAYDYTPA